jgi:hypothetical protein
VLKIGHRMIRRSHFCEHRMNSREEENKCISTRWSGGTIGWLHQFILCFLGNIQRGIRAEMASTGWTDAIIGSSDAQKILKCSGFLHKLVEKFISFPTSTRSLKMDFGAESYGQNAEGQRRGWQDEPLVPSVQLQYSDAEKLVKYSGFSESCVEFHKLSNWV